MNNPSRPSSARQRRLAAKAAKQRQVLLAIVACFVLILSMFFALLIGNLISLFADDQAPDVPDDTTDQPGEDDPQNPPVVDPNTIYISKSNDEVYKGNLILVNHSHKYVFPVNKNHLVNIYDSQTISGTRGAYFQLSGNSLEMEKTAYNALDKMMLAFYEATTTPNVLITGAYRSYAQQEGKQIPPGYSDHHTGLSATLRVHTSSGHTADLSSDPVYDWIYDNCYKYGFIVRYPDGKEALTQVPNYNYYFRYVGYIHAYIMGINDMCLEQYIPYVQGYSNTNPLMLTADDGISYEIYYVPAAPGGETSIPVPSDHPYTISGDNEGGFIVTVTLS